MNGLTGKKMQDIFETLVPPTSSTNARYLVEYCCFRFLSRDSSEFHPCLKVSGNLGSLTLFSPQVFIFGNDLSEERQVNKTFFITMTLVSS